jgi:hypothetical protein
MTDIVLEALNRAAEEHTPEDIDAIIAFLRKSQAAYSAGKKPEKEGGEVTAAELTDLIKIERKATPGFKRRI